jgi:hypothetical protein
MRDFAIEVLLDAHGGTTSAGLFVSADRIQSRQQQLVGAVYEGREFARQLRCRDRYQSALPPVDCFGCQLPSAVRTNRLELSRVE